MSARFRRRSAHSPAFYDRAAEDVARDLLGDILVSTIGGVTVAGRIVESEAYIGPADEASHAAARTGRTRRNEAMFAAAGVAYVYRIYGLHWCLNAVTGALDFPAAVLLRAIEPVYGLEAMRARRVARADRDLARGPARLCEALGVGGEMNAHPLNRAPLFIVPGEQVTDVAAGPRIGVVRAAELPLRFWERGSRWVSG